MTGRTLPCAGCRKRTPLGQLRVCGVSFQEPSGRHYCARCVAARSGGATLETLIFALGGYAAARARLGAATSATEAEVERLIVARLGAAGIVRDKNGFFVALALGPAEVAP